MDQKSYLLATALVSGHVQGQPFAPIAVNVLISGKPGETNVNMAKLISIQEAAAKTLTQKMQQTIAVVDIVLTGIIHLGDMTEEEFLGGTVVNVPDELAALAKGVANE